MNFLKIIPLALIFTACQTPKPQPTNNIAQTHNNLNLSDQFKNYWFSGLGEVNTYALKQSRYGEIRNGHASLIFVTEDFSNLEQVKASRPSANTTTVLKLNATKKFNTGIYPYSIMQSVFDPLTTQKHAKKLSFSSQEWCGQVYTQLNNREQFEVKSHSYFQNEADQILKLDHVALENEVWTQLRINPSELNLGKYMMLPSLEFIRLQHASIEPSPVEVSQTRDSLTISTHLNYPSIGRHLHITQKAKFPFTITSWKSIYQNDTTSAQLLQQLHIDYWNKNANKFLHLRDSLKL